MPEVRSLRDDDVDAVYELQVAAFRDLERRLGWELTEAPADSAPGLRRIRHLAATDPGGAWVATDGDEVIGAALALVREGLWGLSLLVVQPGRQSGGAGSALLRRALVHGEGTRGGIILSSQDSRALRAYARAGFAIRPSAEGFGPVLRPPAPAPEVRLGRWPQDRPIVDAAGRAVRGATHAGEIPNFLAAGQELLIHDGGGFAVHGSGALKVLAAGSVPVARALLQTVLARTPQGEALEVAFIDFAQDWAVPLVLDAGLGLRLSGATFVRGDVGPLSPYIPSGAYL